MVVTYFACAKAYKINRKKSFSMLVPPKPLSKRKFENLFRMYLLTLNLDTPFRLNKFLQNLRSKPLNVTLTNILETPKQVCILSHLKTIYFFFLY